MPQIFVHQRQIQDCIRECADCHAVCIETGNHCLQKGGNHAEAAHLRLLSDCGEICALSADAMLRESEFIVRFCDTCADVCERCAQSCEQRNDDEMMQQCISACRRCSESCRRMVGAMSMA